MRYIIWCWTSFKFWCIRICFLLRCFGLNKEIQLCGFFTYPFRFWRNAVPTRPDNRGSTVLHLCTLQSYAMWLQHMLSLTTAIKIDLWANKTNFLHASEKIRTFLRNAILYLLNNSGVGGLKVSWCAFVYFFTFRRPILIIVIISIHWVALARRQRRDLSVFASSYNLHSPQHICQPYAFKISQDPFSAKSQAGKLWITILKIFSSS